MQTGIYSVFPYIGKLYQKKRKDALSREHTYIRQSL